MPNQHTSDLWKQFFTLIDTLKEQRIHAAAAARAIGEQPPTVRAWRQRGSGVREEHIEKLIQAFPEQLKEKAEELGILTPAVMTQEDRLAQLLKAAQEKIAELTYQIEQMDKESREEKERLQSQINTLMKTLDRLTK